MSFWLLSPRFLQLHFLQSSPNFSDACRKQRIRFLLVIWWPLFRPDRYDSAVDLMDVKDQRSVYYRVSGKTTHSGSGNRSLPHLPVEFVLTDFSHQAAWKLHVITVFITGTSSSYCLFLWPGIWTIFTFFKNRMITFGRFEWKQVVTSVSQVWPTYVTFDQSRVRLGIGQNAMSTFFFFFFKITTRSEPSNWNFAARNPFCHLVSFLQVAQVYL